MTFSYEIFFHVFEEYYRIWLQLIFSKPNIPSSLNLSLYESVRFSESFLNEVPIIKESSSF